jgi:uncharacterized membrane protein YraQ (UPF0718 family)
MDRLTSVLVTFVTFLSELVVLFLAVSFAITLLTRWIGLDRVGRWMGGGPLQSALKGIALGFATPFCTYSAIPMLVGLRQAGVRTAGTVGFLLAAPVLDPLLFAAFAVLFSPWMATSYSVVAFSGVLSVSLLVDWAGVDEFRPLNAATSSAAGSAAAEKSCSTGISASTGTEAVVQAREAPPGDSGEASCPAGPTLEQGEDNGWKGWRAESKDAWQEAVSLTRGMAWHIVGAVAIAALVMGYLPENVLLSVAGPDRWYAIPAAALVGVPFYVSVEALAPVGAALASKGMSVGAVFALTIAGAGVNVPEFALLDKLLTRRGLVGLVGAVFTVAVAGGFVMQML